MFILLKRIILAGWLAFWRQGALTLATVFVLIMTLSLVTSLYTFNYLTQFIIKQVQNKVDISVYFKREAQEEDILGIKEEIAKIPQVKEVEYVSHQKGVADLLQRHPELEDSVEETKDILNLACLNIKAFQSFQYASISQFLEKEPFKNFIEKIDYLEKKPIIEKIFYLTSKIKQIGFVISAVLAIVAFLLTFNQIKIAIFNLKEEIAIQRLVGASNWFISGPFLVQGLISGILACLITIFIFSILFYFLSPKLIDILSGFDLFDFFKKNFYSIFLIQLVTGMTLAIFSSLVAIRKYLKI